MIRLLILGLLGYGLYRALKSLVIDQRVRTQTRGGEKHGEVDDVLIQDPICKAYFARRTGVLLHFQGQDHYFCSKACRDRFIGNEPKQESDNS